jgi:hypothetical protein
VSTDDREAYSTARPYTCRDCGGAMRTSGIDGRCINCYEPPPMRCEFCGRVRHGAGRDWFDHPRKFEREVLGQCKRCGDERREAANRLFWSEFRKAERRKATGQCKPFEGDVFAGMREGDE